MSAIAVSRLNLVGWAVFTTTVTFATKVIGDKSKIVVRSVLRSAVQPRSLFLCIAHPTVLEQLLEQL